MRWRLALYAVVLLGTVEVWAERPEGGQGRVATRVPLGAVPEAPRRALERAAQNHPIGLVIRRHSKDGPTYETTVRLGNARVFVKVTGSGEVIERRPLDPGPVPSSKPRPSKPRPRPTP